MSALRHQLIALTALCITCCVTLTACGPSAEDDAALGAAAAVEPSMPQADEQSTGEELPMPAPLYATEVITFSPGPGAGFGAGRFPEVVFGPPAGGGLRQGSLDVLSLGVGGEIVLGFGDTWIEDGEGADFIIFENAFEWGSTDTPQIFAELAEVSVSEDGERWEVFPCDPDAGAEAQRWPGCAGWRPTLKYPVSMSPLDPVLTGGDAFDLADVGLTRARYIKIRDLGRGEAAAPAAGFDLDAVGRAR